MINHWDLSEIKNVNNGTQRVYKFPNGMGASVVRHDFSYGGNKGLWEIAVLDEQGSIDYSTPITNDVIGHQTDSQVTDILEQIKDL